ncbi:MAG: hypothetical protein H6832_05995 [Planctomycetes bacterium]|nr:hypothetical protein [Planctomycetota bacterium]MCB9917937.1 hypothetical protein [Planctomycetota bacterium]
MLAVASENAQEALRILHDHEDARLGEYERSAIAAVEQLDGDTCPACLEPLGDATSVCGSCGLRFA